MPFNLLFTAPYRKREKAFLRKHAELRERYFKTLRMLEQDPFHSSLRMHPLKGRLSGLHSVSLTLQYRITLELEIHENEIVPVHVGSHGEVY